MSAKITVSKNKPSTPLSVLDPGKRRHRKQIKPVSPISDPSSDDDDEDYEEEDDQSWETDDDDEEEEEEEEEESVASRKARNKKLEKNVEKKAEKKVEKKGDKRSEGDKRSIYNSESDATSVIRRKPKKRVVLEPSPDSDSESDSSVTITSKDSVKRAKDAKGKGNFLFMKLLQAEAEEDARDEDDMSDDSESDSLNYESEDEKMFMKERYERIEEPAEQKDRETKAKTKEKERQKKEKEAEKQKNVEAEYLNLLDTKRNLVKELRKRPSKIYEKALKECKSEIKALVCESRQSNVKKYRELVHNDANRMNEYKYFKKHMSHSEQQKIIQDFENVQKQNNFQKPYRIRILESNISVQLKEIALHKIDQLSEMMPGDPEYHKLKTWIDTFMKIPFGIYKNIDINVEKDGLDACNDYMTKAQAILDECVYGLDDSKLQIMQMLGQWLTNPAAMGTAIAIKGSPGTGKTSLIKDGISKILGREFVFIPLGGAGDSSYLEGHSYTYEGSMWGKIVQTIIDCKCMNPVIYFDELDKVSETPRGEEIIGVLTHLTDTTQNMEYHDKYFSEIREFDLSKCLFIFSYNDETKVNPILLNRMYVIQTKGYATEEKMVIARKYLLPKIAQQVNFKPEDIVITEEMMRAIITDERLTRKEDGVRNLKRCLEIIYTKLNLYRVMNGNNTFFQKYKDIPKNVQFPFTLCRRDLDLLVKHNDTLSPTYLAMYN